MGAHQLCLHCPPGSMNNSDAVCLTCFFLLQVVRIGELDAQEFSEALLRFSAYKKSFLISQHEQKHNVVLHGCQLTGMVCNKQTKLNLPYSKPFKYKCQWTGADMHMCYGPVKLLRNSKNNENCQTWI